MIESKEKGWRPSSETLSSWGRTWLKRRATDGVHRNADAEALIWRVRIAPHPIAEMQLSDITTLHVRDWLREQVASRTTRWNSNRPYARNTLVNAMNTLRGSLRDAVEEGLIESNPARDIRVPRMPRTSEEWTWLNLDEVDRLLATYPEGHQRNCIVFALYTGMRAGEIFGLHREDVDFDNNVIIVRRSFDGPTKNGKVRRVPMLPPARQALRDQMALVDSNTTNRFFVDNPLVFPGTKKAAMRKCGYNAQIGVHARQAGINRRVRFHDLRHSCASHLLQGSWGRTWTLPEISQLLGHSSIHMTMRYAHLCEGGIARAALDTQVFRPMPVHLGTLDR